MIGDCVIPWSRFHPAERSSINGKWPILLKTWICEEKVERTINREAIEKKSGVVWVKVQITWGVCNYLASKQNLKRLARHLSQLYICPLDISSIDDCEERKQRGWPTSFSSKITTVVIKHQYSFGWKHGIYETRGISNVKWIIFVKYTSAEDTVR